MEYVREPKVSTMGNHAHTEHTENSKWVCCLKGSTCKIWIYQKRVSTCHLRNHQLLLTIVCCSCPGLSLFLDNQLSIRASGPAAERCLPISQPKRREGDNKAQLNQALQLNSTNKACHMYCRTPDWDQTLPSRVLENTKVIYSKLQWRLSIQEWEAQQQTGPETKTKWENSEINHQLQITTVWNEVFSNLTWWNEPQVLVEWETNERLVWMKWVWRAWIRQ